MSAPAVAESKLSGCWCLSRHHGPQIQPLTAADSQEDAPRSLMPTQEHAAEAVSSSAISPAALVRSPLGPLAEAAPARPNKPPDGEDPDDDEPIHYASSSSSEESNIDLAKQAMADLHEGTVEAPNAVKDDGDGADGGRICVRKPRANSFGDCAPSPKEAHRRYKMWLEDTVDRLAAGSSRSCLSGRTEDNRAVERDMVCAL